MAKIKRKSIKQLISENDKLAISFARKFVNRGIELEDLIQEARIGLMKAAERYDYKKGFQFSTYATPWILQSIKLHIYNYGKTIRVPIHRQAEMNLIKTANTQLSKTLGRNPTEEQISEYTKLPLEVVIELSIFMQDTISLETPVSEGSTLGDFVKETESEDSLTQVFKTQQKETVLSIINELPEKQALVLKMRFGLGEFDSEYTLDQIGETEGINLTKERIRQLEEAGLKRLKHPAKARRLASVA